MSPLWNPFSGSLWGKDQDNHPLAAQWLEPGQSRLYEIEIRVHTGSTAIDGLLEARHRWVGISNRHSGNRGGMREPALSGRPPNAITVGPVEPAAAGASRRREHFPRRQIP